EALASLKKEEHRKNRVHELMTNKSYKRYLTKLASGRLKIKRAKVHEEEKLDGKYLITASDETLTSEDLALGYKHLQEIERAWRRIKDSMDLMPVRHYAPRRIRAHVRLAQLALPLTRLVGVRTGMTWHETR